MSVRIRVRVRFGLGLGLGLGLGVGLWLGLGLGVRVRYINRELVTVICFVLGLVRARFRVMNTSRVRKKFRVRDMV